MSLTSTADAFTWLFAFCASTTKQLPVRSRNFLTQPLDPCVIRQEDLLTFSDADDERVAREARSWAELSERFRQEDDGPQNDEVFPQTTHWGAVYPFEAFLEPYNVQYCHVVEPPAFEFERLCAPMLLVNNDMAWTSFHVDSIPSLQTVSQLLVGRKAWFIVKAGDLLYSPVICNSFIHFINILLCS